MTRLPYATNGGETAERIRARRGGELRALDRMLLHSPPVADGWNALLGAIRERTALPADLRELVILRVAALNGAEYEWAAHEPVAREAGVDDAQLAAVRETPPDELVARERGVIRPQLVPRAPDEGVLGAAERAALAYTDAMTREIQVPQAVFDALHEHFDERQVVELTATVGTYNLVSRFLVALEIGS